jgi:hypothetical protein
MTFSWRAALALASSFRCLAFKLLGMRSFLSESDICVEIITCLFDAPINFVMEDRSLSKPHLRFVDKMFLP